MNVEAESDHFIEFDLAADPAYEHSILQGVPFDKHMEVLNDAIIRIDLPFFDWNQDTFKELHEYIQKYINEKPYKIPIHRGLKEEFTQEMKGVILRFVLSKSDS